MNKYLSKARFEGALLTGAPVFILLAFWGTGAVSQNIWQVFWGGLACVLCLVCGYSLMFKPNYIRFWGFMASIAGFLVILPVARKNPFVALMGFVITVSFLFILNEFVNNITYFEKINHVKYCWQQARGAFLSLTVLILLSPMLLISKQYVLELVLVSSFILSHIFYVRWALSISSPYHYLVTIFSFILIAFTLLKSDGSYFWISSLLCSLMGFILISTSRISKEKQEAWWEFLINNPARLLFTTFFLLCCLGTLLLMLPFAAQSPISLIDAAFTSVSAVCVTGLIVLDTPNDFTISGQAFILLLIQLGGLGIMSITTVALHSLGHRLSLKQERLLTTMTDTDHKDLVKSLQLILGFTLVTEFIGALVLSIAFYSSGETLGAAIWRGVFTAVSAFCNAGFALQSDSLIPYQSQASVLQTVSLLIILGGLAPAVSLAVPKWFLKKKVPVSARIALVTTAILLLTGTLFMLAFEWNGLLKGLSIWDKFENAWFQSVTLRTAGFNSVDLTPVSHPMFLIMLFFMAVGGSPGGTAGGVKTTTLGLLFLTFWAHITNRDSVVIQNKRIPTSAVYRAITIMISGVMVWFLVVLMLELTQQMPILELIFEATSAIGTVGLSIGATARLDEIGKIIIIFAMFAGRVGPMSLFMLLSKDNNVSSSRYLDAKISLT